MKEALLLHCNFYSKNKPEFDFATLPDKVALLWSTKFEDDLDWLSQKQ